MTFAAHDKCHARKFYQLVRGILQKWKIREKGKMYLTHGAETWIWTKANISRLMAAEINFFNIEGKPQWERI
jgi:hypothetical protein